MTQHNVFFKAAVLFLKTDMDLLQLFLCSVLFISTTLHTTDGITEGCEDWELSGRDEVCCLKCNPGTVGLILITDTN